jgi:hypothetical protein
MIIDLIAKTGLLNWQLTSQLQTRQPARRPESEGVSGMNCDSAPACRVRRFPAKPCNSFTDVIENVDTFRRPVVSVKGVHVDFLVISPASDNNRYSFTFHGNVILGQFMNKKGVDIIEGASDFIQLPVVRVEFFAELFPEGNQIIFRNLAGKPTVDQSDFMVDMVVPLPHRRNFSICLNKKKQERMGN